MITGHLAALGLTEDEIRVPDDAHCFYCGKPVPSACVKWNGYIRPELVHLYQPDSIFLHFVCGLKLSAGLLSDLQLAFDPKWPETQDRNRGRGGAA